MRGFVTRVLGNCLINVVTNLEHTEDEADGLFCAVSAIWRGLLSSLIDDFCSVVEKKY